jgi:hypothetical protein
VIVPFATPVHRPNTCTLDALTVDVFSAALNVTTTSVPTGAMIDCRTGVNDVTSNCPAAELEMMSESRTLTSRRSGIFLPGNWRAILQDAN